MSKLIHSDNVKDVSHEQSSTTVCDTARTPLSDNDSLNAKSIVGFEPSHQGLSSHDAREVARKIPQSGVGCNRTSLNVGKDIVGNKPRHPELDYVDVCAVARINPLSDVGRIGTSLDVGNDIGSRIEQCKVDEPINLGNDTVPTSLRCTVSSTRW